MITIDGSLGEGGGQVLRTALSLSAITGTEIELKKIRAGRAKPGLKRQHLTCVKAVAEICGAKVSEVGVSSMELGFKPGTIKGGDYRFDVGTAGSVTLVAQTVIPVLVKADEPSTVTITGGTHVPFAPIWEFFAETYLSELRRMGAKVEAELVQPGLYPAPAAAESACVRLDRLEFLQDGQATFPCPVEDLGMVVLEAVHSRISVYSLRLLSSAGVAVGYCDERHMPIGFALPFREMF